MRKILLFLIFAISTVGFSQAPQMFRYQAVARDVSGAILADQPVGFQIRILQGSSSGVAIYVETHAATTNEFGLVNLIIGNGSVTAGDFGTIDWGADSYYMEVAMDASGGSSYIVMGTSQLLSVPYALYAETSGSGGGGADGLNCWDLDGDGVEDPSEDTNGDGSWDALDCQGADGATGPAGADGADGDPGVTGQEVNEVYGSAQITPPISASFSLVPGLSQTLTVPADCYCVVTTDGGVQCASAGANYAVVDIAIHVDGVASPSGGQRRIVAANTSSLGQVITNWSITKTYVLTPGAHTFEVGVMDDGTGSSDANVSSGTDPRMQATLQVMFIKF